MNRTVLPLALATFAICACKSAPQPFKDPPAMGTAPVRVQFNPPEDKEIRERSVHTRLERASGTPEVKELVTAAMSSRFDKSGEAWVMTQNIREIAIEQNGARIESELASFVTKFPIKLRLASDGTFVDLVNVEEINQAIRSAFPGDENPMAKYFSPEAIGEQAKAEWSAKYGAILGREVAPGTVWYDVESLVSTRGEVWYAVERKVEGARVGDHGRELVISATCPVSPEQALSAEAMKRALEAKSSPSLEPTAICKGEQVIGLDPFTPRSTKLEVAVRPIDRSGNPVEIIFTRSVETQ